MMLPIDPDRFIESILIDAMKKAHDECIELSLIESFEIEMGFHFGGQPECLSNQHHNQPFRIGWPAPSKQRARCRNDDNITKANTTGPTIDTSRCFLTNKEYLGMYYLANYAFFAFPRRHGLAVAMDPGRSTCRSFAICV